MSRLVCGPAAGPSERTFWDKVVILHGVRNWFENRGVLRGQGQRVSRHYYDVHCIFQSELGARAARKPCARRRLRCSCKDVFQQPGPKASITQLQASFYGGQPIKCS